MSLTDAEITYLQEQQLGRLATIQFIRPGYSVSASRTRLVNRIKPGSTLATCADR